jgi:hypothetical protein
MYWTLFFTVGLFQFIAYWVTLYSVLMIEFVLDRWEENRRRRRREDPEI